MKKIFGGFLAAGPGVGENQSYAKTDFARADAAVGQILGTFSKTQFWWQIDLLYPLEVSGSTEHCLASKQCHPVFYKPSFTSK